MLMKYCCVLVLLSLVCSIGARDGFGEGRQDWGHVTVRPGAHMFWWLYYTTADVKNPSDRPVIIWLQGGPGASSTGYGNFEELGPLDLELNKRNHTWVKDYNVLFIDNPVGTGFSYVDNNWWLTKTNAEIANDLVALMKAFYKALPEFEKSGLHIFSESYGGKMAAEFAYVLDKEIKMGGIKCDLKSVGIGDSWVSPIETVMSWAEFLFNLGFVDSKGYQAVQASAIATKYAFDKGQYAQSTNLWGATEGVILKETRGIDFYNVMKPQPFKQFQSKMKDFSYDLQKAMYDSAVTINEDRDQILNNLMNGPVKQALGLPKHVVWGSQSGAVFSTLAVDFMKPVTHVVELLLNTTSIDVAVFTGTLDLICATPGNVRWVENLQWPGQNNYLKAPRNGVGPNGILEGYSKSFNKFYMYWALRAGHMVPADNPVLMAKILQTHTKLP